MDQLGWSFLGLWAAPGSLLSISLMNSDSLEKHLFAQDVAKGRSGLRGEEVEEPQGRRG